MGDVFDFLDELDEEIVRNAANKINNNDDNDDNDDNNVNNVNNKNNKLQLSQAKDTDHSDDKIELWDTKLVKVKPSDLIWAKIPLRGGSAWFPARKVIDKSEYILHKNVSLPIGEGHTVIEYIKIFKKNPETFQICTLKDEDIKPYDTGLGTGKKQTSLTASFVKSSKKETDSKSEWNLDLVGKLEKSLQSKYSKHKGKQIHDEIMSMAKQFLSKALEVDERSDGKDVGNAQDNAESNYKRKLEKITDFDLSKIIENSKNKKIVESLKAGDYIFYNDKVFKDLKKTTRVVEINLSHGIENPIVKLENDDIIDHNDLVRKLSLDPNGKPDESSGHFRRVQEYSLVPSKIQYVTLESKIRRESKRENELIHIAMTS